MKRILGVFALSMLTLTTSAQDDATNPSNWKFKAIGALTGTQANFKNWNAGGQNTLSWIALFDANANWKKDKWSWMNGMNLAYGKNRILTNPWAKTDDIIAINSKVGYSITKDWSAALLADFKTQFDFGYDADNIFRSKFMAPGYLVLALGFDYKPNDKFTMLVAPVTGKITFVNDFTLAQAGAYGVDPTSDILSNGFGLRKEFGGFLRFTYSDEVMQNVTFKGRLELFSNYFNNPQNIDVNLQTLFNFKINKWLQASWSLNLIYDDDIDITVKDENNNVIGFGPRAQIKNVLSLGLSYTFLEK
ncbi:MAG TPA: DUF3078 domain-containing protein [Crocinitomix sp.]|nr:DUF3078 domain-containing protein [Crocinitomix sp.]